MSRNDSKSFSIKLNEIFKKISNEEIAFLKGVISQDPFKEIYKSGLTLYTIFVLIVLLWPFDFNFFGELNKIRWIQNSPGIHFIGNGKIISNRSTKDFCKKLIEGDGLSIELWVTPEKNKSKCPPRILSYSINHRLRNFTLAQQDSKLLIAIRTENTSLNGTKPMLTIDNYFNFKEPTHIVVSYNYKEQKIYKNGSIYATSVIPGGKFTNWSDDYSLIIGNEATGDCPWLGKISYVAIYNYPLKPLEVKHNYEETKKWNFGKIELLSGKSGFISRYLFNENSGREIKDYGALTPSLDLTIPEKIYIQGKTFLNFPMKNLSDVNKTHLFDIFLNVILFIPFGFLLNALMIDTMTSSFRKTFMVITICCTFSIIAETLQYFIASRHSSVLDVTTNFLGSFFGVTINQNYNRFLKRKY